MSTIADNIKAGDWKGEKHVPFISAPDSANADEVIQIRAKVGEEIAHPNTVEHFIAWIDLYFVPDGGLATHLGRYEFTAHGEGPVLAEPSVTVDVKLSKSGTLKAMSYCNIHGLWESEKAIAIS
jgi:superoxide reductase